MKKEIFKNIIIIILLFILLNICYSMFIRKDYPVKFCGISFLIVATDSMNPTIKSGELIAIKQSKEYMKNDIVTYLDEDELFVTHRIIDINNKEMITKGDGNNINDSKTNIDKIKGKVIFHSKILGFFVLNLLRPLIVAYIIVLIIINFITFIFSRRGRRKEFVEKSKNIANN